MHTVEAKHTYFHFNGDFSGDVMIVPKTTARRKQLDEKGELHVPFEDLKKFLAEYVRRQRAAKLEALTDDEVLR